MKTVLFGFLGALGFGWAGVAILGNSAPLERMYGAPAVAVKLANPAIDESSGLARSHRFPGKYYTHNDSGDTARFWRFDLKGNVDGPYSLKGASAVDWEDMASARIGGRNWLFFGDIGDNAEKRASLVVYRVEEPSSGSAEIGAFDSFELTYPNGSHNAETLLVDPNTGEIEIVTKAESGKSLVFRLAAGTKPGKHKLEKVGEVALGSWLPGGQLATGGDVSPDGRYVVVRTYLAAYEFDVKGKFSDWTRSKRRTVGLALERQGEAICYSLDGGQFVTSSEFSPCQISTISIKP